MRKRPGEARSAILYISGTFAVQSCRGQVVRRRILRIRARLSGRVKLLHSARPAAKSVWRYTVKPLNAADGLLDAMTIHVLVNRAG